MSVLDEVLADLASEGDRLQSWVDAWTKVKAGS